MPVLLIGAFREQWAMSVGFKSQDPFTSELVNGCSRMLFVFLRHIGIYQLHFLLEKITFRKLSVFAQCTKLCFFILFQCPSPVPFVSSFCYMNDRSRLTTVCGLQSFSHRGVILPYSSGACTEQLFVAAEFTMDKAGNTNT